jgi:HSP20 family protein
MAEQVLGTKTAREVSPINISFNNISEQIQKLYDQIAHRAYEIFEGDGRILGRHIEDWFRAETEVLHPVHLDLLESPEFFSVRAEVPGFSAKDLDVNLEPRRLTISGKRETKEEHKTKKTVCSERCSDQILRVLDLPAEVDAEKVKATLKDGILELDIPKAASSRGVRIEPKAA